MGPLPFRWDGEAMVPAPGHAKRADEQFVIGETYTLAPVEQRSQASHGHFFALVNEAWASLPEGAAERFPTADHLRKYALIKTGFCEIEEIACTSKAEALRWGQVMRRRDDYAVVVTNGPCVRILTAKSQSMREMGKEQFQASKEAVLGFLATLLGVSKDSLARAA